MDGKKYYDIKSIKSIPIPDVLARFGIEVNHAGFFAIRNERTPSAKYYRNTNTYCDFGMHNDGGDVLKLYAVLAGLDMRDAIEKMAIDFGVLPEEYNHDEIQLSDSQWQLIGLYGDMASKNMTFDFEHYSLSTNYRFAQKYHISMNELKKRDLRRYENIIVSRAIPYVERMKLILKQDLQEHYVFQEFLYENEQHEEEIEAKFEREFEDVKRAEKILEIACKNCLNVNYHSKYESVTNEYEEIKARITPAAILRVLQDNPIYMEIYCATTPVTKKENDDYIENAAIAAHAKQL